MFFAILIISIILIAVCFYVGNYFSDTVCLPEVVDYDEAYEMVLSGDKLDREKVEELLKNEFYLDSRYGYKLHGYITERDTKKFVVFCHGYSWNLTGDFKYTDIFLNKDYSVVMYDHRNHGKSGGSDTSFGYYEKYDLQTIIEMLRNKYGYDIEIGLHGESMGAATVMQYLPMDSRISFCIEDCGFMDAKELFHYRVIEDYKVNFKPLIYFASVITKIKRGWFFRDTSPIKSLKKTKVPILFIHGEEDLYIRINSVHTMHKKYKGPKILYTVKGAEHAMSYSTDPDGYRKTVNEFLGKNS